ncbi:MAG: 1-deoxy-D-xylulose-5-phosphate reductoisomerase [Bacteroidales bacterium]|nr:1-deoxy-D-xylulose-5-phosphate reductoisomerase [Bacteroidales bacterium]
MKPVKLALLGSTGSIGRQTLQVISSFSDGFEVVLMTSNQNVELFLQQISVYKPSWVFLHDTKANQILKQSLEQKEVKVLDTENELYQLIEELPLDVVVLAYVGIHGLEPAVSVVKSGKRLALANKEVLVSGGHIIMQLAKQTGATIVPIDSEHSAILQCLLGEKIHFVEKIFITASGGPFWGKKRNELIDVTLNEALSHPTWRMGDKITIDSATLMNKGFEVIEAYWLFGLDPSRIEVIIHPQSIIHSMVQFVDGSMKAQMSVPDMRIPILYALTYPNRLYASFLHQNVVDFPELQFFKPDVEVFKHLKFAYEALKAGPSACCVLNAANDYAVSLFLQNQIAFLDMQVMVEKCLEKLSNHNTSSIEEIIDLHRLTIAYCQTLKNI